MPGVRSFREDRVTEIGCRFGQDEKYGHPHEHLGSLQGLQNLRFGRCRRWLLIVGPSAKSAVGPLWSGDGTPLHSG